MALIGVLGGMGPLATVDFLDQVVRLTDASCDQEHLPMVVANLPHTPDRSRAIVEGAENPLPALIEGIDLLNRNGVALIVIPCNSAHHWYAELSKRSIAPILHISEASIAELPPTARRVALLATGGTLASDFYQTALAARGREAVLPSPAAQADVAACIAAVKAGEIDVAAARLGAALASLADENVDAAMMACTEIPLAARTLRGAPLPLVDSTRALARATVNYALARGWNRAV
jgi:aspartate racemase